jgi:hypothetical protein
MNALMSSGVALSKSRYPGGSARYSFPRTIKELSASKGERQASIALAKRLQRIVHASIKRVIGNEQKLVRTMCAEALRSGIPKEEVYGFLERRLLLEETDADKIFKD